MSEWVTVEEFPDYSISRDGQIRNNKTKMILKQSLTNVGYYRVSLSKQGKSIHKNVHRLLGLAFIPNPENKEFIDHLNHDRTDNRLENLRWVTRSENAENQSLHKDNALGESNIALYYKVNIKRNGIIYQKMFKNLEDAKIYRDMIQMYHVQS